MEDNKKMTTEDVALALGVSTSRVRQILERGDIPGAVRHGDRYRGWWEVDPEQVEFYKTIRKGPGKPKRK